MSQSVQVHDLHFDIYITHQQIQKRVDELGAALTKRFKGKNPIFLAILNGSFIFAADLSRSCDMDHEITFIKLASYEGTSSTGKIVTHIGLTEDIEGKDIVIIEDIIDTGNTLYNFLPTLKKANPNSITIAALLTKPTALEFPVPVDFIGFEIPNKFVVGYGLDYNGLGRNLKDIYQLSPKK
jgi:hypoxanthine phosphoribosyltransferase